MCLMKCVNEIICKVKKEISPQFLLEISDIFLIKLV